MDIPGIGRSDDLNGNRYGLSIPVNLEKAIEPARGDDRGSGFYLCTVESLCKGLPEQVKHLSLEVRLLMFIRGICHR